MVDALTNRRINALAGAVDELSVKFAGLVAVLGAMTEKYPVDPAVVDAWCVMIAATSDSKLGVGQTAIQRVAHDLLRGRDKDPKGQP
jgi:hypothetical protein